MGSKYEKYTFSNNQNSTLRTLTIFLLKAAAMAGTTYEQEEYKKKCWYRQLRARENSVKVETAVQMKPCNQWIWPELSMYRSAVVYAAGKDRNGTTQVTHLSCEMVAQTIWNGKQLWKVVQASERGFLWLTNPP